MFCNSCKCNLLNKVFTMVLEPVAGISRVVVKLHFVCLVLAHNPAFTKNC